MVRAIVLSMYFLQLFMFTVLTVVGALRSGRVYTIQDITNESTNLIRSKEEVVQWIADWNWSAYMKARGVQESNSASKFEPVNGMDLEKYFKEQEKADMQRMLEEVEEELSWGKENATDRFNSLKAKLGKYSQKAREISSGNRNQMHEDAGLEDALMRVMAGERRYSGAIPNVTVFESEKQRTQFFHDALKLVSWGLRISHKKWPRHPQLLAVYQALKGSRDFRVEGEVDSGEFRNADLRGRLSRVLTGEGKTMIVVMLAVIQAYLGGKSVDIITSSEELAMPAALEYRKFYAQFDIGVAALGASTLEEYRCNLSDLYSFVQSPYSRLVRDEVNGAPGAWELLVVTEIGEAYQFARFTVSRMNEKKEFLFADFVKDSTSSRCAQWQGSTPGSVEVEWDTQNPTPVKLKDVFNFECFYNTVISEKEDKVTSSNQLRQEDVETHEASESSFDPNFLSSRPNIPEEQKFTEVVADMTGKWSCDDADGLQYFLQETTENDDDWSKKKEWKDETIRSYFERSEINGFLVQVISGQRDKCGGDRCYRVIVPGDTDMQRNGGKELYVKAQNLQPDFRNKTERSANGIDEVAAQYDVSKKLAVTYGTAHQFRAEFLNAMFNDGNTKRPAERGFDMVIIDEVDNAMIDNVTDKTYLSGGKYDAGFSFLTPLLAKQRKMFDEGHDNLKKLGDSSFLLPNRLSITPASHNYLMCDDSSAAVDGLSDSDETFIFEDDVTDVEETPEQEDRPHKMSLVSENSLNMGQESVPSWFYRAGGTELKTIADRKYAEGLTENVRSEIVESLKEGVIKYLNEYKNSNDDEVGESLESIKKFEAEVENFAVKLDSLPNQVADVCSGIALRTKEFRTKHPGEDPRSPTLFSARIADVYSLNVEKQDLIKIFDSNSSSEEKKELSSSVLRKVGEGLKESHVSGDGFFVLRAFLKRIRNVDSVADRNEENEIVISTEDGYELTLSFQKDNSFLSLEVETFYHPGLLSESSLMSTILQDLHGHLTNLQSKESDFKEILMKMRIKYEEKIKKIKLKAMSGRAENEDQEKEQACSNNLENIDVLVKSMDENRNFEKKYLSVKKALAEILSKNVACSPPVKVSVERNDKNGIFKYDGKTSEEKESSMIKMHTEAAMRFALGDVRLLRYDLVESVKSLQSDEKKADASEKTPADKEASTDNGSEDDDKSNLVRVKKSVLKELDTELEKVVEGKQATVVEVIMAAEKFLDAVHASPAIRNALVAAKTALSAHD